MGFDEILVLTTEEKIERLINDLKEIKMEIEAIRKGNA